MTCRAAVLRGVGQDWEITDASPLDPPRGVKVLVKMAASGICHTDDHFASGDSVPSPEFVAMMEANGIAVPDFFPSSAATRAPAWSAEVGPGVRSRRNLVIGWEFHGFRRAERAGSGVSGLTYSV